MALNMAGLQRFQAGLDKAIDAGVEQTAREVKDERDQLVHVDTGALRDSGVVVQVAQGHWQVREGDGLPDARAAWEEFGTDKHGPHAHMVPAAEKGRQSLPKHIATQLQALAGQSKI